MNTRSLTKVSLALPALALGACSSSGSAGKTTETTAAKVEAARADAITKLDDAAQLITDFREKIPASVTGRTQCVIAVPSMVKGGIIVGGESGKGYATCRTASGWSAPAPITIGGGTLGAQLGVSSTDLVALVTSQNGMRALLGDNFKVGVNASATAGPVGTGRGTATDMPSKGDVLSYSRAQGLYAGAELNGSTIKMNGDAAHALYGSSVDLSSILGGRTARPNDPAAQRFLSAVEAAFPKPS